MAFSGRCGPPQPFLLIHQGFRIFGQLLPTSLGSQPSAPPQQLSISLMSVVKPFWRRNKGMRPPPSFRKFSTIAELSHLTLLAHSHIFN